MHKSLKTILRRVRGTEESPPNGNGAETAGRKDESIFKSFIAKKSEASKGAIDEEQLKKLKSNVNFFMKELEVVTSSSLDDHPARKKRSAPNASGDGSSDSFSEKLSVFLFR